MPMTFLIAQFAAVPMYDVIARWFVSVCAAAAVCCAQTKGDANADVDAAAG